VYLIIFLSADLAPQASWHEYSPLLSSSSLFPGCFSQKPTREKGGRQCLQSTHATSGIRLTSNAEHPERGNRNREPQPLSPCRVHHFGLVPLPSAAFAIFEAPFEPTAHPLPQRVRLLRGQIRVSSQYFGARQTDHLVEAILF
jgi:hypothetical protein